MRAHLLLTILALACAAVLPVSSPGEPSGGQSVGAQRKRLHLIAGSKSHGYGQHAFRAGCILLKKRLDAAFSDQLETFIHFDGWPKDPGVLNDADAICIYCDGGSGHPINKHLDQIDRLAKKGVGLAMIHYAVEVPKEVSGPQFLDWIGGYFEMNWSVNPHWRLRNVELAKGHPITRGVKEYYTQDEWYYHMRFRDRMEGVTSILAAMPPPESLSRPDGPHSGNPAVRDAVKRGERQVVAWARERPDGGRGFGFTGAHFHWTWADDNNRKLVLNALAWISKLEVPADGVTSSRPTIEELEENQDFPKPAGFDTEKEVKRILGVKD
jgi:hypothetical protein